MFYVYIIKSLYNGKIYTGFTSNLKRRYNEHKSGKAWTTARMLPIRLIFYEAFLNKDDAVRREKYLKTSKGKSSLKQILRNSLNI